MSLNIVYIGPLSFPYGLASTKRRRYMIDYLNLCHISAHVLCTRYNRNKVFDNPLFGCYGETDYYDISKYVEERKLFRYYEEGRKYLKRWFDPNKNNILIFHTMLNLEDYPFFVFAYKLGYKIIFDQVETSYISKGTNASFKRKCYIRLCELVSHYAYKKASGSFVISKALWQQNKVKYPDMPLCLLPNSTPVCQKEKNKRVSSPMKIFYSGTYAPKDGVKDLINGFIKAVNQGIDCVLVLTGQGISEDMKVLDMVKDNPRVKYLGFLSDEDLLETMLSCDLLAMTRTNSTFSNFGFPFKLSEYLSSGNAVLATKVSDVLDYLEDKKNALLVEPENENDIADAIKYAYDNPTEMQKIAALGLETMQQYFSINTVGEKFVNFLKQI